jgi:hypothetical protein
VKSRTLPLNNVPGDISNELQLKAAKWLFEAAYGRPTQAVQPETHPEVQRTLIVRWIGGARDRERGLERRDCFETARTIEPEPD